MTRLAARTYWQATARPPRLSGTDDPLPADAESVVIGGGYTGLAAAARLASEHGSETIVLEADTIGAGASGRNAGMVVPHVGKVPLSQRIERWGSDRARASIDLGVRAVRQLQQFVARHIDDVGWEPATWAIEAATPQAAAGLRAQALLYERLGVATVRFAEPTGDATTGRYGALLHEGCALVHPLDLARAAGEAATRHGVRIFEVTPVRGVSGDRGALRVMTDRGDVRARRVVFATNAYTSRRLHRALHARVARFRAYVVATQPLTDEQWDTVAPAAWFATDSRKLVRYWRRLPDGGLLFGGPGPVTDWHDDRRSIGSVVADLHRRFPTLADAQVRHAWRGDLAASRDRMPHVAAVDGVGAYAFGYAGTGVALAFVAGRAAADLAVGERTSEHLSPLCIPAPRFPLSPLLALYPTAARIAFWVRDHR